MIVAGKIFPKFRFPWEKVKLPVLTDKVVAPEGPAYIAEETANFDEQVWDGILKSKEEIMQQAGMTYNAAYYAAQVDTYRHQTELERLRIEHMADVSRYSPAKTMFVKKFTNKEKAMATDTQICTIYKVKNGFTAKMTNGETLVGATLVELCEAIKAQVTEDALMRPAKSEDDDDTLERLKPNSPWVKVFK